jgi:hypothetical protein
MAYKNKEDQREYRRQYYQKNKEKTDAQNKEWRRSHPDQAKEIDRKHYLNHREQEIQEAIKYNGLHPEQRKQAEKKYRQSALGREKRRMYDDAHRAHNNELARANYARHRESYIKKSNKITKERRERFKEFKRTQKCSWCGEAHESCIEFHHRDPSEKDFQISSISHYPWNTIMEEIKKCDVLCSNCHRKTHFNLRQEIS